MFDLTDPAAFQITVEIPGEYMKRTLTVSEIVIHGQGQQQRAIRKGEAMKLASTTAALGGTLKDKLHS